MKQIVCVGLWIGCLLSFSASAQWQWVDKQGRTVFSDLAPPSAVPDKSIVRRPSLAVPLAAEASSGVAPSLPGSSAARPSGLAKALAEKKIKDDQTEQANAAQRKAEEAHVKKRQADNCERAKQAKAGLDSGLRMSRITAQGQREFLDDAGRAAEAARLQAVIESDCK